MPNYTAGLKIIGNGSYGVINPNLKFVVQIIEHKHLHCEMGITVSVYSQQ